MAPFIPEGLVNPQLNLFFALVLGIGFGYVLEQAGFSSSRKLAGVFYGYDFVVLRVFFTAGITAMTGLLFLSYMGWIDMSLVYINPYFVWSAIVGGLIMGLGFILGGYCPGTSIVAAVTGKTDAMLFLLGAMIGIFIFGHYYNEWLPLYEGHFLGNPFIYETLGISRPLFGFMMVMAAVIAFAITQKIEDNINKTPVEQIQTRPSYTFPGFLLILAIAIFLFLPEQRKSNTKEVSATDILAELQKTDRFVDVQEVTYKIMNNHRDFVLIDVRDAESYAQFSLPGAVNIPLENLFSRAFRDFFNSSDTKKIFYGYGNSSAEIVWTAATRAGISNIYVLNGGLNGMFDKLFNGSGKAEDPLNLDQEFEQRFIAKAKQYFLEGKAARTEPTTTVPIKTIIQLQTPGGRGGC